MRKTIPRSGIAAKRLHPPIRSIRDALSFRIARMAAINERVGSLFFQEELGLRVNEWRVLGLVTAAGTAAFSEVRGQLLIDKGQLSRVVRTLVERGLLKSYPSLEDGRQVDLVPTAEGRAIHDRALSYIAYRNEVMTEVLSAKECADLLDMLGRLIDHNERLLVTQEHA
ncbi:MarR family winged helix-turn-helix transcriptional regulator [Lutimaribacter sp. EGI FJ00015]|uniref:MarR family winged helix-turn-helix transcriptional regulator n=1 Tax=Lutimaribacter degradans TaxID=2945989 RepID=A0ACC5ZXH0_9RHOB|nr:MarR family winged helix-turn-helix transcriptional regulator [Lutimaribacter sp. EGI FJ00013]MCM2563044.1 MarR family winged helix-turn-helix transcriptional regulator [Lutimaribacter sp. EGI FJ00013]MCO0614223.1 MarR family winged helix-turn-helix transcriptional regulator [Lutimaribacter sp. EGI FJ00015]MCO0637033.1 MarR family winged helix-turn-helix transcriptional regulator [Lutimaribacter sp. EGI FJ00014]